MRAPVKRSQSLRDRFRWAVRRVSHVRRDVTDTAYDASHYFSEDVADPWSEGDALERERQSQHAALRELVSRGDCSQLKQRLAALGQNAGLIVNLTPGGANTLLYVASEAGLTAAVSALLEAGADGRAHPVTKYCPLYIACYHGHVEIVKLLLAAFPEAVKQETVEQWLPLHAAVIGGHPSIVTLLLDYPYPESVLNTYTDASGRWQYLAAFDVNARDARGQSALYVACALNNVAVLDALLAHTVPAAGGQQEEEPTTPSDALSPSRGISLGIHAIVSKLTGSANAERSSTRIAPVRLDTSRGADSCVAVAARGGHVRLLARLLAAGADPNASAAPPQHLVEPRDGPDRRRSRSAGAALTRGAASPATPGYVPDRPCVWTALSAATAHRQTQAVELLLQRGATAARAHCGAVQQAALHHLTDLLAKLLATKAYPDPEYKLNKSAISEAVFKSRREDSNLTYSALCPSTGVMVSWRELGAQLTYIRMSWIRQAALHVNSKLSGVSTALFAVTRIDVSNNELRLLPPEIFGLISLRHLNAAQNKLERLPTIEDPLEDEEPRRRKKKKPRPQVYTAPALQEVYLQDNRLEELPATLFQLPALQTLDVSNNKLRQLPDTMWSARALRDLNVALNHLRDLPTGHENGESSSPLLSPADSSPQLSASSSTELRTAHTHEKSTSRSPSIERSESEAADDDDNAVPVIGNRSGNAVCSEARRAHVWRGAVGVGEPLPAAGGGGAGGGGSTLTSLNLAHNQFTCVPPALACRAANLTRLNMAYNSLRSMSYVTSYPTSLRQLDLSHNEITCWPSLPQVESFGSTEGEPLACYCPSNSAGAGAAVPRPRPRSAGSVRSQLLNAACPARRHLRLESLRTLILANNLLTRIQLTTDDDGHTETTDDTPTDDDDEWSGGSTLKGRLLFPLLSMLDVSCNLLRTLPPHIHELTNLSVLNISGNKDITDLPPQMGLLSRLWNLNTVGCSLSEPLRSMVSSGRYKSMDIVGYLKSVLQEARPYARMKLMFVGLQSIGKTSLLECLRQESAIQHRRKPTEHWAKRMGNKSSVRGNVSTVGVDIGTWVYEKHRSSRGPITFRTWDFGGQQEYYATHQYFLSRRSLYLVVWRVTDGRKGLAGAIDWLRSIQARAPGSPVIMVATHYDQVPNVHLPENESPECLQRLIRSSIMGAPDADKLGLPRVLDSLEVSCSTRHNIRLLADIIYSVAYSVKPPGSKEPLLEQRVPATYLALEECVTSLASDLRDPVLRHDEYKRLVTQYMQQHNKRMFRDAAELHQATMFLHENGVLLHYDDATLKELYFLKPQWLCDVLAHVVTVREINPFANNGVMKVEDLAHVLKASPLLSAREEASALGVALLNKFELALCWDKRLLLVPPLLPHHPPHHPQLSVRSRSWSARRGWPSQLAQVPDTAGTDSPTLIQEWSVSVSGRGGTPLRRLLLLSYVPCGFWSRLCARLLADQQLAEAPNMLYKLPPELELDETISKALELSWGWKLWKSGVKAVCGDLEAIALRQLPARRDALLPGETVDTEDGYYNVSRESGSSEHGRSEQTSPHPLYATSRARRSALLRARARAQFARDAGEARAWVAEKLAKLAADHQQGEVTNLEDKIKKLQKHQAFTAELAANKARLQEVELLCKQLAPDQQVQNELDELRREWDKLQEATELRGRGLEEAQDILEFNQNLDKIEAWIRDKEMMVQAHELGRDYEHCSALLRKLDDVDTDMQVDEQRVKSICALADKLLQQGPTQQAATVSQRRDTFLAKWRALTGALQHYRDKLTAALEIHAFNRDVEDTAERISKKATLFSSSERGRELAAAHELKRKHLARAAEAQAIKDKIHALEGEGKELANKYPERAKEIETSLQNLREGWDNLQKLAAKRTALLDEAIAEHKFDESLKELDLWVSEAVKRMDETDAPESVSDAESLLELHHEKKAEIDGRQKVISSLQKEAEQAPEKMKKVEQLSTTLEQAWLQRKQYLTQAHQLQLLREQARQTEDWLAGKEAFLNNDDLGDNLDAVEALIKKHADFSKLLDSQLGRVDELQRFATGVLQDGHYDQEYIQKRLADILARRDKLKESCKLRGEMLEQSRQLHLFLRDLYHEREWISLKMQVANDQNYRELSNLQSKIQKHAAFESELAANKGRIDDVACHGESLIEAKHYASQEIAKHVEGLENQWRELQVAAKLRRERLQEAYQARVYLRGLDDFTAWLDDVESQLLSEDHGKDLASVTVLLKRHTRLEQQVASKSELATQLVDNARQLADSKHFMAQELLEKADTNVNRYRQLQEPMQIRRDNLEDAALLHRWDRDADEEFRWLRERSALVRTDESLNTLQETQASLKKHLALEGELIAREPSIKALVSRASALSRRGHFAGSSLDSRSKELMMTHSSLRETAAACTRRIQERCELLQLTSEISEAEAWLLERRPALVSIDVGRDEDSALALANRLATLQRELTSYDVAVSKLEKTANGFMERATVDCELVKKKLDEFKATYEDMKLLSAKRQQRLQQSLKYFKFVQECEEVQEWIGEQMTTAASEDYGLDVEHVETLQQAFDNFLAQLQANEGRIEAVCEAGNNLLEENTPEADRVKQRIDDIRGLWDDLKELALARQEALAGARQVHEFDRWAEETGAWVAEKDSALDAAPPRGPHERSAQQRALHALRADLDAITEAHRKLQDEATRLSSAFPDAAEHVSAKLEDVTESLHALVQRADQHDHQLELAGQLQAYFDTYQELLAWTNETLARVTAPDLAGDVSGAERLLARHRDIRVEIQAKDDAFQTLYRDGEKLVKEGHFMSNEIEERMSLLRSRRAQLEAAWTNRETLYEQHLDALVFKRDADALDNWITNRVPLVRDGKLGESVAQVEELINRHKDLEETIDAHKEKFNALKRITLVEQAFKEQRDSEEAARRVSAERQEAERLQMYRRREMERIAEERRRDTVTERERESDRAVGAVPPESPEETLSPAPQFDRLPVKTDTHVKRAESMNVSSKTPKRTPSFTTRRRTQSFRRHRRGDVADLPPVEIEGYLERKQEAGCGGKRATVRSWRGYHAVLCGQLLCFFRDEIDFASAKAAAPPVAILNARCEPAGDYTKRANVFRLCCADGAEYLFACSSKELMKEWVAKLSFHASLPPELQLTPYSSAPAPQESPTAEMRRRLHENASSSSSEPSSPSPSPRPRTQAEILHQHREHQRLSHTPERNIESTVLPSLPPRQPPPEEDSSEVVLRNQTEHVSGGTWGKSRFSNGRDINSEFIRSQQSADHGAPPLPSSGPPDRPPLPDRLPHLPDRPPNLPERGPNIPERGPNRPERVSNVPDRAPNLPERLPNVGNSRNESEKQSVSALVSSYQQRMSGYQRDGTTDNGSRDGNRNEVRSWQNNNYQNVETTSHFYSTGDTAYGGNTAGGTRPASVAGGSPALDTRPASRSSGESELSVSGVTKDKKDKKGVFGGLFSRKKRPQSHM